MKQRACPAVRASHPRFSLPKTDPLLAMAACAAAGIAVADFSPRLTAWPALAGFLGAAIAAVAACSSRVATGTLAVAVVLCFAALHAFSVSSQTALPGYAALERGECLRLEGSAVVDSIQYQSPASAEGIALILTGTIENHRIEHPVRCAFSIAQSGVKPGQRVALRGHLTRPETARNPGEFDRRAILWRRGASIEFHPDPGPPGWETLREMQRPPALERLAQAASHWVAGTLTRDLEDSPETAGLLLAMVLGQTEFASETTKTAFRLSGAYHLFAVSGLNVGMVALILWSLLKPLGVPRRQLFCILSPLLFLYALLTGLQPPAVRAAIMFAVFLAGLAIGKRPRILNSLGAAAIVLLASDTHLLFLPGFQLSFGVLLAIVAWAPRLSAPWTRCLRPDPFLPRALRHSSQDTAYRACRRTVEFAAVSIASFLGSLPISWFHFGLITPAAILANCLLVPLAYLILFCAMLAILTTALGLTPVAVLLNNANHLWAALAIRAATDCAALPAAYYYLKPPAPVQKAPLELAVLHMPGGGQSIHLAAQGSGHWWIDTGSPEDASRVLRPYLRHAGIRSSNTVILTHNDVDHAGGYATLNRFAPPDRVLIASWPNSRGTLPSILKRRTSSKLSVGNLSAGTRLGIDEGVALTVLYPPADSRFSAALADDRALVIRLDCWSRSLLLTSDAGFITERWLLESCSNLDADLLLCGRREGDLHLTEEFLAAVSPAAIVLSEDSPSLPSLKIPIYRQDLCGAVLLRLFPEKISLQPFIDPHTLQKNARWTVLPSAAQSRSNPVSGKAASTGHSAGDSNREDATTAQPSWK